MEQFLFPEILDEEQREREANRQADLDSLPSFDNPKDDNEVLLNLQRRYLVSGDRKAWSEMWTRCLEIAGKLISIEQKEKGLHYSEDEKQSLALDAVAYVLRRYSKPSGDGHIWHVKSSFLNALRGGVLHALYYEAQDKPKVTVIYAGDIFDVLSAKEQK